MIKLRFLTILSLIFVLASCNSDEFLEVENLNKPDRQRALSNASDLNELLAGGSVNGYFGAQSSWGAHFLCMGDQVTSTNRYRDFWSFADEPRLRVNNTAAYDGKGAMENPWSSFNSSVYASNAVLQYIADGKKIDIDGVDKTAELEAMAYALKGYAQGYLGVIFDQAYIVDIDTDLSALTFSSYADMIDAGVANMEKAISLVSASSADSYDFLPGVTFTKASFLEYINSYAARILASKARSKAEDTQLGSAHWTKVMTFANNGFKSDFNIPTTPSVLFSSMIDWSTYTLSDGSGYLPTDIKITHLADNTGTYPDFYPAGDVVLDPVQTDDERIDEYFEYARNKAGDPSFGYLNAQRNKGLFTNYRYTRYWNSNDQNQAGVLNPTFMKAEIDLLKAEAKLKLGQAGEAAAIINNGPRVFDGGLPEVSAADNLVDVMHYEYSIELNMASGLSNPWAFMRRNDLLIEGTPTELPVPASELEATGKALYTFGGKNFSGEQGKFGEVATAGPGGWKASE